MTENQLCLCDGTEALSSASLTVLTVNYITVIYQLTVDFQGYEHQVPHTNESYNFVTSYLNLSRLSQTQLIYMFSFEYLGENEAQISKTVSKVKLIYNNNNNN
jgi:hypothetical protein